MDPFDRIKQWPEGPASTKTIDDAATMAYTLENTLTYLTITAMAQNGTLNLTVHETIAEGARLFVQATADATGRVLTLGTGFDTSVSAVGIGASQTAKMEFVFSNDAFHLVAVSGAGPDVISIDDAAAMPVTITNQDTILTIAEMAQAGTLNLTVGSHVKAGAALLIKVSADATGRNLTHGTKLTGAVYAVGASKSVALSYRYDGTNFIYQGVGALN